MLIGYRKMSPESDCFFSQLMVRLSVRSGFKKTVEKRLIRRKHGGLVVLYAGARK